MTCEFESFHLELSFADGLMPQQSLWRLLYYGQQRVCIISFFLIDSQH